MMYFLLGFFCLFSVLSATKIKVQDRPAVPHNATLHRRNDFNKYGGCNKQYAAGIGKQIVTQAKEDMLAMAQYSNPFLYDAGGGSECPTWDYAGVLEKRFFGNLLNQNDEMKTQIYSKHAASLHTLRN